MIPAGQDRRCWVHGYQAGWQTRTSSSGWLLCHRTTLRDMLRRLFPWLASAREPVSSGSLKPGGCSVSESSSRQCSTARQKQEIRGRKLCSGGSLCQCFGAVEMSEIRAAGSFGWARHRMFGQSGTVRTVAIRSPFLFPPARHAHCPSLHSSESCEKVLVRFRLRAWDTGVGGSLFFFL